MNLLKFIQNWKLGSLIWKAVEPIILKLVEKKVPTSITSLYENSAKHWQPLIDSIFKLKAKCKETPSELDDFCFNQAVNFLEAFANYLLKTVQELKA